MILAGKSCDVIGSKQSHDNNKDEVDLDVIINQISTDFLVNKQFNHPCVTKFQVDKLIF